MKFILKFFQTIMEINYWTNGKICAKVVFPRYTESVKFRSQSRERASKRKPYLMSRGHNAKSGK